MIVVNIASITPSLRTQRLAQIYSAAKTSHCPTQKKPLKMMRKWSSIYALSITTSEKKELYTFIISIAFPSEDVQIDQVFIVTTKVLDYTLKMLAKSKFKTLSSTNVHLQLLLKNST